MELTEAQAAHFDAFGFVKLRAFSDGEVRAMVAEAEAADPACSDPVERSELLTALMVTRLLPAMRRLLGEGFVWSGSECNISRGERQDGGRQNLGTPLPSEYRRALGLESRYQEHTWHAGKCSSSFASSFEASAEPLHRPAGGRRVRVRSHQGDGLPDADRRRQRGAAVRAARMGADEWLCAHDGVTLSPSCPMCGAFFSLWPLWVLSWRVRLLTRSVV